METFSGISSLLRHVLFAGTRVVDLRSRIRSIQLTNAIAVIASFLFIILETYLYYKNGWSRVGQVGLCTIISFFAVILLNHFQQFNFSRSLICVIVPIALPAAIFLPRINLIGEYNYFRSPEIYCILICCSAIPLMVFSLKEKKALSIGLFLNALVLFSFDFVLYRFSNAYQANAYTILRFISAHIVVLIMFLFITGCIAFLKNLFEYFEEKNDRLIAQLHLKNKQLHNTNMELLESNQNIEAQNEEILSQSEELLQSQESLMLANAEIERQKKELQEKNELLETALGEKNFDLLQTNHQLINQNSDLQQFSFTVSHNLRAPVASMKGLINLYHLSSSAKERSNLMQLIEESTGSLDTVIQDLGKILDIRHNNFNALEKVNLQAEVDIIIQSLSAFIHTNHVSVQTDFEQPDIVSIKAYLNSILYNLISNAIQYRSPSRNLIIKISSRLRGDHIVLEISDNGLGLDLSKYGTELFKLYKRFHSHTPGKGLGLFLVRQQLEKLNATIDVDSIPDLGTTFRIFHLMDLEALP